MVKVYDVIAYILFHYYELILNKLSLNFFEYIYKDRTLIEKYKEFLKRNEKKFLIKKSVVFYDDAYFFLKEEPLNESTFLLNYEKVVKSLFLLVSLETKEISFEKARDIKIDFLTCFPERFHLEDFLKKHFPKIYVKEMEEKDILKLAIL